MNILFLGGDKRQIEIINDLAYQNHKLTLVGYDNLNTSNKIIKKDIKDLHVKDYHIIIFPVNGVLDDRSIKTSFNKEKLLLPEDLLTETKDYVLIFTGIMTKQLSKMLAIANREAIVLMDDNEIKKANSIPTVEGIIGNLVYNTDYTINDARILVLGYGNVGKSLVDKLTFLGAKVTIGVILDDDYKELEKKKRNVFKTIDISAMKKALNQNNIVINTVPSLLIDKKVLPSIKKDTYLLDISSYPHGIDFREADKLEIKYKLWLGIPAEVAPKTAGNILTKKINKIIRGK